MFSGAITVPSAPCSATPFVFNLYHHHHNRDSIRGAIHPRVDYKTLEPSSKASRALGSSATKGWIDPSAQPTAMASSERAPGDDDDVVDGTRVLRACAASTTGAGTGTGDGECVSEMLRALQRCDDDDANDAARKARRTARAVIEATKTALSGVLDALDALERDCGRNVKGTTTTAANGSASNDDDKVAKTTSRILSIADEGEFPTLESTARRNLAMTWDSASGSSGDGGGGGGGGGGGTKPRRVAPTPMERTTSGGTDDGATTRMAPPRRIAPTMVSRPLDSTDGLGGGGFASNSGAATPVSSKPGSLSTSPSSATRTLSASGRRLSGAGAMMASTPPSIERLYVTDPKSVEPVELAAALGSLASLHAAALRFGYPLDQASNLASVCRLLAVPGGLRVVIDDDDDGLSRHQAAVVVRTGREAHAYACAVLARIPTVACALGESALEALVESSVLAAHAPSLHAKLVRELGVIRVASSECERAYQIEGRLGGKLYGFDLLDALAEADDLGSRLSVRGGRVLPLADQQLMEHNRERTRDAFYSLLRASASRSAGSGQDASLASRARAVIANTHPANMRWLADLFVARLSQSSAVGETDEELGKSITPARLSRLHERIVGGNGGVPPPHGGGRGGAGRGPGGRGRGRSGGGRGGAIGSVPSTSFGSGDHSNGSAWPSFIGLFPSAQQPYVRFIEATDSHKFCVALQRSLVAALHALDPNSKASCLEKNAGNDQGLSSSRHAGQTERMLAARAMGSFLGLLTFGFATSGSMGSPSSSEHSPSQGINLTATLRRATRRGELVVSAPWVLAFLRFIMWDAESLESAHYADALAYLRAISSSPNLSAAASGGEFNASRTCLRSILAVGLSATAPVTTAQASNWYTDAPPLIATLPPPPVAAADAFPTTSRECIERVSDPLAASVWGVDWIPAVSANASVAANTVHVASAAPDSPSGDVDDGSEASDARAETEIAPDLSRVGVDKRYVEYACPSLDAAVKTLRRRRAIAKSFVDGSSLAAAATAHTQPVRGDSVGEFTPGGGLPRRMQAQPQRVEPTRTTPRTNFGGSSSGGASPTFGVTSPTIAQPTSTGGSGRSLLTSASPSPSVKHALQRAFLQNLPGLRRLVDFAVDAATLAAVDDATAAVTANAVESARASVSAAATQAANKFIAAATQTVVPHSSSTIEEAWTPDFERAVERAAMSATRDVIASVAATAAEDAGARAAAAVAALSGSAKRSTSSSSSSSAATRAACGVAADAASFAASDRVRRNLPFELHARIATDGRRLLKAALCAAKESSKTVANGGGGDAAASEDTALTTMNRNAEYASVAASAIASALSSASKWPAGKLVAECSSLKSLIDRGTPAVDALTLSRAIQGVVDGVKKVLEQDVKFIRTQTSRRKPSSHVDKVIPDSRPGEKLAAALAQFARAYVKLLLAAPQNALSKTTKAKTAEEGWGMSRDDACDTVTSTFVAAFEAATPALQLVAALAPPNARDPWEHVYEELFAAELWLGALREFPESPFAQRRIELVFSEAAASLPRRHILCACFLRLIDDADKRVGRIGHALALRAAIRFGARASSSSTFHSADVRAVSDFCRELEQRCERAGETRLARRASTARRALDAGDVYANIKQQQR